MKPTPFSSKTTPWRVQVPGRYFPDRKRKARYFASLEAADKFVSDVRRFGLAAIEAKVAPAAAVTEHAPLILAAVAMLNGDSTNVFEACKLFQKTRLNVKGGIVSDVVDAFDEARKSQVSSRTRRADNCRLNKFIRRFGNTQILDITEAEMDEFFSSLEGHKRSTYKTVRVFFAWARRKNFIAIDPMAGIEPPERWNARKEIYSVATFERMLRIAAGLEGCRPGEEPTQDFIGLLPWMIISGFCGLRSCEAFRNKVGEDSIRWEDLKFDRGFIHIRHDVAKRTARATDKRNIETSAYVEAARAWLALVPRNNEFLVGAIERTLWNLKNQFEARTGIKFKGNAFRNSFASYALTAGKAGVGQLAREMGNSEAVCLQFYVDTLEPQSGAAWFGLRPDRLANIVPLTAAIA